MIWPVWVMALRSFSSSLRSFLARFKVFKRSFRGMEAEEFFGNLSRISWGVSDLDI
jgi:hypothetical protein